MSMSMLDGVLEERVHNWHKRTIGQLTEKIPNPDSPDRDRGDNIHPGYKENSVLAPMLADPRAWTDQKVHVDEPHKENKDRDGRKLFRLSLEILLKQDK